MKQTLENNIINKLCPEHQTIRTVTTPSTYWLTIGGLQKVRAHVALGGMDIVADVTKALVKQYGRKEAKDIVKHLYDESTMQPDIHRYVESLISAL